jgi:hypothetical protein
LLQTIGLTNIMPLQTAHLFKYMHRVAFAAFLLALGFAIHRNLFAATVTNTNDSGPGSLRNALAATPAGGTVDFALSDCPCTIVLTSGDLAVTNSVSIIGPGAQQLTISGNNRFRPFRMGAPYTLSGPGPPIIMVALSGVKVTAGLAGKWPSCSCLDGDGGGILAVDVDLTLRNSLVTNNAAFGDYDNGHPSSEGGGIAIVMGSASIINSTIAENTVGGKPYGGEGGGIANLQAKLTITDSVIKNNHAPAYGVGGAIYSNFYTANEILRSTISGNDAGEGSGLYLFQHSTANIVSSSVSGNRGGYAVLENVGSRMNIVNSTVSSNTGIAVLNFNFDDDFGNDQDSLTSITNSTVFGNDTGLRTEYLHTERFMTKTTVRNSIVAGNRSSDVVSPIDPGFESSGYNLIGNAGSERVFSQIGDLAGSPSSPIDPRLEMLAFNGGPTQTHALKRDSPAIDHGKAFGSTTDQRGWVRPMDDAHIANAPGGDGSDIGAVEEQTDQYYVPRVAAFDFDGDGRSDESVFRPSDRYWYLNQSTAGFSATQFGFPTDLMAPADFDGDGKTDIGVYRSGTWYLQRSTKGFIALQFGTPEDMPFAADYDGDGKAEIAVWRPSTAVWYVYNLETNETKVLQYGSPKDIPLIGDYDGDGKADYAAFSEGWWFVKESAGGTPAIQFGLPTDKPVPADYDGDGKTDMAVFRGGMWYVLGTQTGFQAFQFGVSGDIPTPADYDGDGKTDAAVFRSGDAIWYELQSQLGFKARHFGLSSDRPVRWEFVDSACSGCWD